MRSNIARRWWPRRAPAWARRLPTWCRCCCRAARALVSTATKSLQDQLFLRDLPRLTRALRLPARLALLKGRASYLCLHRLQQSRASATLPDRFAVRTLARIEQWASATRSGDLAELEGLDERSPVIPLVTSTRENCLGTECPSHRDCHVMRARRDAMAADLVVINHHLFFADLALRDSGVAELLPTVDAAVFDEAHQLVETGVQFLGVQAGHQPVDRLCARSARGGPVAGAWTERLAGAGRRLRACGTRFAPGLCWRVARVARRRQVGVGRACGAAGISIGARRARRRAASASLPRWMTCSAQHPIWRACRNGRASCRSASPRSSSRRSPSGCAGSMSARAMPA